MFLMKLEAKEKFAFLQLSHYVARVDGIFGSREEEIIEGFCLAMGVENTATFDEENFSLELTLKQFGSVRSKKTAILALMVLVHIDDHFDTNEYDVVCEIMEKFNLDMKDLKQFSSIGKLYSAIHEQAVDMINEA